jgi:hypothetical protein
VIPLRRVGAPESPLLRVERRGRPSGPVKPMTAAVEFSGMGTGKVGWLRRDAEVPPTLGSGRPAKGENAEHRTSNIERRTPNIERRTSNAERRIEEGTARGWEASGGIVATRPQLQRSTSNVQRSTFKGRARGAAPSIEPGTLRTSSYLCMVSLNCWKNCSYCARPPSAAKRRG